MESSHLSRGAQQGAGSRKTPADLSQRDKGIVGGHGGGGPPSTPCGSKHQRQTLGSSYLWYPHPKPSRLPPASECPTLFLLEFKNYKKDTQEIKNVCRGD